MKIKGLENLTNDEINFELQNGAKFVVYNYCFSVAIMTFKRPSDIHFVRSNESPAAKGLPYTVLSLIAGWWGIPWGPIYTIQSVYKNSRGGIDVTQSVLNSLKPAAAAATI